MRVRKELQFRGTAYDDLLGFPADVVKEAGFQLRRVQQGLNPDDWKPMSSIGAGVREVRLRQSDGTFRVIFVAKFETAVFVLHCFQKKTQKTPARDVELSTKRYRDLVRELKNGQ